MRSIRTDKKRLLFLACLKDTGGNVSRACEVSGIARQSLYDWRLADPVFAKQWDDAVEFGTDQLEQEARRRAYQGVDEPVFYQGEECGAVRKYSDTLLIFLLKGRRPDKYRERVQIDVNQLDSEIEQRLASMAAGSETGITGEVKSERIM